jgi:hypothetical protein
MAGQIEKSRSFKKCFFLKLKVPSDVNEVTVFKTTVRNFNFKNSFYKDIKKRAK